MHSRRDRNFFRFVFCATFCGVVLMASTAAQIAHAATVTVNSTCTVAKAVATINARANQSPCTHSGTFGSNDTVVVPDGNFDVTSPVDINRSMTIHGAGKWTTFLQIATSLATYAFKVNNPSIVVKIDNLFFAGPSDYPASAMAGIVVNAANDSNLSDNNLELSYVVVSGFTGPGIINSGGRVLVSNTLIYLNTTGAWGAGVHSRVDMNSNGTQAVPSFVAKNSAISINTASSWAGGIYSEGKLDLRSTLLQENQAPDGAAIFEYATYTSGTGKNTWCNVRRDSPTSAPSEIDDNVASGEGQYSVSIIDSDIPCAFNDTIAAGNSSPYCNAGFVGCPQ